MGCHSGKMPSGITGATPTEQKTSATPDLAVTGGVRFEEVAAKSGLDFRWPQQPHPLRNLEAFGTGCAFLDYDNDGWQDILLIGTTQVALYRNLHNGKFEDVSRATGLADLKGYWTGCAVADVDGDGYLDILLTGYRRLALLHNVHGTRFEDITVKSGLDPTNRNHWASSAGFMDLRGDGHLDLVLCNYVIFNPKEPQYCEIRPGIKSGCPPAEYRPEYPELWQNLGGGKFVDVTQTSGMKETHGKALVVAFADFDGSGKMGFYIGNDGMLADLMKNLNKNLTKNPNKNLNKNLGGLHFKNVGIQTGVAYGALSHAQAAMGADWADYDRDGRPDLAVSAFSDEPYSLYHNQGGGAFELVSDEMGLSGPTLKPLGFGTKWIDVDNDGWPDLLFANGHVYDNVNQIDTLANFRQPLILFRNEQGKQLRDLVPELGGDLARPILGRGLATGDYDNDGKMDFLVVDFEGSPMLMHNISQTPNHWITIDLHQDKQTGNPFAYGATVTAKVGKEVWIGTVSPASSYLSSSDPRIHFGLGTNTTLDTITVRWPDGKIETVRSCSADHILRWNRGRGIEATGGGGLKDQSHER